MLESSLAKNGYTILTFKNLDILYAMQEVIQSIFLMNPTELHKREIDDKERLLLVKQARDKILEEQWVKKLILSNSDDLIKLLGPDIDIQSDIYLRVSRPNQESDFIDWHRDTFYGNSHWEFNFWFPVFPLAEGAGLMVIEGSHLMPAKNIHSAEDQNGFRNTVTKGSLANELGYTYAPKQDDTISNIDSTKIKLLSPKLGEAILFFTHVVHRAQNTSTDTRVSIDLRLKNMFAPTDTRAGYFQPLLRSVVTRCVEKMLSTENTN